MSKDFWVHSLILLDLALFYCVSYSVWFFSPVRTNHPMSWFTSVDSVSIRKKAPCQRKAARRARHVKDVWLFCLTVPLLPVPSQKCHCNQQGSYCALWGCRISAAGGWNATGEVLGCLAEPCPNQPRHSSDRLWLQTWQIVTWGQAAEKSLTKISVLLPFFISRLCNSDLFSPGWDAGFSNRK